MTLEYQLKNKFWSQRRSAWKRGIEWNFTFEEWLAVWEQSGKLDQRGRGKGKYVMARKNDSGPYELGNVYITTFEQNNVDQHVFNETKIGKHNSKKVKTPLGIFDSKKLAAQAHSIHHDTMGYRIKHWSEYKYIT